MKKRLVAVLIVVLSVFSTGLLAFAQEGEFAGETVRVGVVGEQAEDVWNFVADKAAEEGIEIDVVLLTDYNIPNVSLQDGSLDMNAFQHDVFLENWNEENNGDIVSIAYTIAVPIRLYSNEYDSIEELPDGATIALNNAPTSLSYNLLTLERAGLITLDDEDTDLPDTNNVAENPKNLDLVPLDGAQIPPAMKDVDAAFIDDSFIDGTDFEPSDAIYVYGDTPETVNLDRVNNIAVRAEDADNPLYQRIVELYQEDDVAEKIAEVSNGGSIPAWEIVEEAKKVQGE